MNHCPVTATNPHGDSLIGTRQENTVSRGNGRVRSSQLLPSPHVNVNVIVVYALKQEVLRGDKKFSEALVTFPESLVQRWRQWL